MILIPSNILAVIIFTNIDLYIIQYINYWQLVYLRLGGIFLNLFYKQGLDGVAHLGHGGGPNREVSGGGQGDGLEKGNRHFAEITFQFTIIFYVKCRYNNKVILSIIEKKYHLY